MQMLVELQWLLLPLLVLSTAQGTHQLPSHFCIDVDVVYNRNVKEYLEGSRSQGAINAAYIIVGQANRFFECTHLGKNITITLRPRKVIYDDSDAAANLRATAPDWYKVQNMMTREQNMNAHSVVFLTRDGDQDGGGSDDTIGMSSGDHTKPVTCYRRTTGKAAIVELQSNSLKTAQIMAHEIGHTLSLPDDKSPCSSYNSVMNGQLDRDGSNTWSKCTLEHLQTTYANSPGLFGCLENDCTGHYKNPNLKGCPTNDALFLSHAGVTLFKSPPWNTYDLLAKYDH